MDIIEIRDCLKNISYIYTSNEEFRKMLKNPLVTIEEKLSIIREIFPEISNENFFQFIKMLLENDSIAQIKEIYEEYEKYCNKQKNELDIKIVVAGNIEDKQLEEIAEKYKKIYKVSKVNYTLEEDKSIIGGVKVIVDNTIYDSSLKSQLNEMF